MNFTRRSETLYSSADWCISRSMCCIPRKPCPVLSNDLREKNTNLIFGQSRSWLRWFVRRGRRYRASCWGSTCLRVRTVVKCDANLRANLYTCPPPPGVISFLHCSVYSLEWPDEHSFWINSGSHCSSYSMDWISTKKRRERSSGQDRLRKQQAYLSWPLSTSVNSPLSDKQVQLPNCVHSNTVWT